MKSNKVILSLSLVALTVASTIYVDCGASGSSKGTVDDPYTSLEDLTDLVLGAGDHLLFKRGSTCNGVIEPKGNGTAEAPITVANYGDENDDLPLINGGGAEYTFLLTNADYWNITGLAITSPSDKESRRVGIYAQSTNDKFHTGLTISGLHVYEVAGQTNKKTESSDFADSCGISVGGKYNDVSILGNLVEDCGGGAIKIRPGSSSADMKDVSQKGLNTLVQDNTIRNCGGDGIIVSYANAPLIQYNSASGLGTGKYPWTGGNFAGMWVLGSYNAIIQHNFVVDSIWSSGDSEAFDCDWGNTGNCTIQYNFSRDNAGGIFLNCDGCGDQDQNPTQVLRYNVFQNDCRIYLNGNGVELHFYNNVVYCPDKEFDFTLPTNTYMSNNIIVGSDDSLSKFTSVEWLNNIFQNVTFPSGAGKAADADFQNPGSGSDTLESASGYILKVGSPAFGYGIRIPGDGGYDFFGNEIADGEHPNAGAYGAAE